jgi:integrase
VVSLKVEDVAPHGYAVDRATVRQSKTGPPVRFEITEQERQAIDERLAAARKRPGDFLFNGRGGKHRCLTTRQYARLLSQWIASIGLDPSLFGTHSLRGTNQGDVDLSAYRQSSGGSVAPWPYQGREHGQVPRHRGR